MIYYVLFLAFLLCWTVFNSSWLTQMKLKPMDRHPTVSILVPLRNEERNVEELVKNLSELTYEQLEVILYNDHSTDNTLNDLLETTNSLPHFYVVDGKPLPEGWVGKVHACHELSKHATGEYYLFIDADVRLRHDCVEKVVSTFESSKADMLTGFPNFRFTNWLDRLIVPMMHFLVYFYLPIILANKTNWPASTAANGAFVAFKRESYRHIDGYKSIQNSLIEDVEIARVMKRNGMNVLLVNVREDVFCTMYDTAIETWFGFTKNSFRGLNNSVVNAVLYTCFTTFVWVMPLILFIVGLITLQWLYMIPYVLTFLLHIVIYRKAGVQVRFAFFHPLSHLLLMGIIWHAAYIVKTNRHYTWKGRVYK